MVFSGSSRTWASTAQWHTSNDGQQRMLHNVHKFKYLGLELHGSKGIKAVTDHRLGRMIAAQSSINRRLRELRFVNDPQLMADMFETITSSTGSYACEIWCTPFLFDWTVTTCKLQRFQSMVYKRSLGVPSSTSNLLAYFECGRYPMQVAWLSRTVKYWNKRVATANDGSLLSEIFRARQCALWHDT
jgi:hypothetical protein